MKYISAWNVSFELNFKKNLCEMLLAVFKPLAVLIEPNKTVELFKTVSMVLSQLVFSIMISKNITYKL